MFNNPLGFLIPLSIFIFFMTTGFSFAILLKIKAISIRLGNQIQETVALKDQSLSLITSGADDFGAGGGGGRRVTWFLGGK